MISIFSTFTHLSSQVIALGYKNTPVRRRRRKIGVSPEKKTTSKTDRGIFIPQIMLH